MDGPGASEKDFEGVEDDDGGGDYADDGGGDEEANVEDGDVDNVEAFLAMC